MNPSPYLYMAFKSLQEATKDSFRGTALNELNDTTNTFAISAAVAGAAANLLPGAGSIIAMFAQTGIIWTLYVKINQALGIKLSDNVLKFIGSAMLTNIITNAGSLIAGYTAASILSFIPGFGQVAAPAVGGALGFIVVYVSAILYLNLLTKVFSAHGSFDMTESDDTKAMIKDVCKDANIKDIVKEGKNAYKAAEKSGDLKNAKEHPTCPSCGVEIDINQKFCSSCGAALK